MTSMLIRRSDGKELDVSGAYRGGYTIEAAGMEDFLSLPINIATSANVLTDGSILISKRIDECERTATFFYKGNRPRREVRDEVLSFFNPRFSFEVHVTHMGRTRWCAGEVRNIECKIQKETWPLRCTFTLLCLDPYMRNEDGHTERFTDARPMFGFPYVSHLMMKSADGRKLPVGAPVSILVYDGRNTVYNAGDVPCMYRIQCKFKDYVANPQFTKDGKFVLVKDSFTTGDVLIIDFESAPPKVTKNGVNIINKCSRDSNFTGMEMQVGDNIFQYTCDNPDTARAYMDVSILYNDRYLGV